VRELSQHILDLLENALEAQATEIQLEIIEQTDLRGALSPIAGGGLLSMSVQDNGRGMDGDTLARLSDPFFTTRTTRSVGLGIPLLKATAERCNGELVVYSTPGQGTCVTATMEHHHVDRAPLGDMASTLLAIMLARPRGDGSRPCDLRYRHTVDGRTFSFDTHEIRSLLGDVPLSHPHVRAWLEEYLREGLAALYA
jgi:hypothetical protein